jgi:hypothetical protein
MAPPTSTPDMLRDFDTGVQPAPAPEVETPQPRGAARSRRASWPLAEVIRRSGLTTPTTCHEQADARP